MAGSDDVPTEIHLGVVIARTDTATSHEEVDNIIAQQAIMCAKAQSGMDNEGWKDYKFNT